MLIRRGKQKAILPYPQSLRQDKHTKNSHDKRISKIF